MKKRIFSLFLALVMALSCVPMTVFAAHDSTGKPLDLTGDVYLALYIGDDQTFPGEPAEHAVSGYLNLNANYESPQFTTFASSAEGILKDQILKDVVQGTSGVWGVFSTTGGSQYFDPACGIVDAEGNHNATIEEKIINTAIAKNKFSLGAGEKVSDYTIIWYVIKYQKSDSAWHIDGIISKKKTFAVNYYGNGNTSGAAPSGVSNLAPDSTYTIEGNTGRLTKKVGNDTYIFNGWNTKVDGTGVHYDPGQQIKVTENVTLYAEWYLQNKYTVTVVTKLDGKETDVSDIHGEDLEFWVKTAESDEYLPLSQTTTGTYTTTVTENGNYQLYSKDAEGNFHDAHGHWVTIYNQNGRTELLNYSVTYDPNGENVTWSEGSAPKQENYHATETVYAKENVPSRQGYTFLYWKDQDGNIIYPGDKITSGITEKTVLTAQWEENIDVTVEITVDHKVGDGENPYPQKEKILFNLLQQVGGVDLPVESVGTDLLLGSESTDWNYQYDSAAGITTYRYTFKNLPQGLYTAAATKPQYSAEVTRSGASNEDQLIQIDLSFAPQSFNLDFHVQVNVNDENRELLPVAVNVRVLYWDGDSWERITQHGEGMPPVSVFIDENGFGDDYFPVWKYWDDGEKYNYRVAVTSFVMPDGTVIPATGNEEIYTPDGSGLYKATVDVKDGVLPTYPNSDRLPSALFNEAYTQGAAGVEDQIGLPVITVDITPFTVTFDAKEGTVNGKQTLVMDNQFRYPDLDRYIAVPVAKTDYFMGWYTEDGVPAENLRDSYLTENVTYYAKYSPAIKVQGTVTADSSYMLDGDLVSVFENDRAKEVLVVLQKIVGDNLVDVASRIVPITYTTDGTGTYLFDNIPNDGTQYRIRVLVKNYDTTYDNESDPEVSFSPTEYAVILGGDEIAVVDAFLEFNPEMYVQEMEVDASRIGEGFRPQGVQTVILYRDMGDIHPYTVISQHDKEPYGVYIPLTKEGYGAGSYSVWNYHTNGMLYEYQMDVTHAFGDLENVYSPDNEYHYNSDTAPYEIQYSLPSMFSTATAEQMRTLKATLIPKEYKITFDLGIAAGKDVSGMDQYLADSATGESYIYHHTWSYAAEFDAFPYLPGYIFKGWKCENDGVVVSGGGHVTVAAALAEDLVLVAQWEPLTGTSYAVRHLEMNTEKPLMGATVVTDIATGSQVYALQSTEEIKGYNFAGSMIDGVLYAKEENAVMTVTDDPAKNVLTIYYLPDESSGFTEQVESNLKLDKTATLENNGTYTITLETFTKDAPVTTMIQQNTPLDIVLVLDQSGSLADNRKTGLTALRTAVDSFEKAIADHGRKNEVDHRIAVVGFASNQNDGATSTDPSNNPYTGNKVTTSWINTGIFDSNGVFHSYPVKGFNYTEYNGLLDPDSGTVYYTYSEAHKAYLLLTHHDEYRHLITEEEARIAVLEGTKVYGYVYNEENTGRWVELTRNPSGLWLYGDTQLYSAKEFFTYHEDVWTHRHGVEPREIHGYGTKENYKPEDGHDNVHTRTETTSATNDLSVYKDALIPVSVGANGSGGVNPGLTTATELLGANGATRAQYGMQMANAIFEANPAGEDRVRIVIMFTDGQPGQSGFLKEEANAAIAEAYKTKNDHEAYVYTIGLYPSGGVDESSDIAYYMNALSSNYSEAKSLADVQQAATYVKATNGDRLDDGVTRYAKSGNSYYQLKYGSIRVGLSSSKCWYFTTGNTWWGSEENTRVTTTASPVITNGKVGNYEIYEYRPAGYKTPDGENYYSTTNSADQLEEYFNAVMKEITTKITRKISLHEDTILRDIMNQGLVLRPGSKITAYKVAGKYNTETKEVDWIGEKEPVAWVDIPENPKNEISSEQTTTLEHYQPDGSIVYEENVPFITVYNLQAKNATNPDAPDYHPHAVDVTGYDYDSWYISEEKHEGFKLVVEITNIEATDDVEWGRSTATNHPKSGLWLPKDAKGDRQLLLAFDQPTTIFVERAYVLDYGKTFTLADWYFDDEKAADGTVTNDAKAEHVDCDIASGMNKFDTAVKENSKSGKYGNTKYGNVKVNDDGTVTYTPTSMKWGGIDQFYVFGETWRKTVLAQDANQNRNLWNKVTVIPANNIYYEDSFITKESTELNGIEGFKFSGTWYTETSGTPNQNEEIPEHLESAPYGDVHGWTDALVDDTKFTDGSAHMTGLKGERGASVEFTFTGTGVDVYTRTNMASGRVVALLTSHTVDDQGNPVNKVIKSLAMDNEAVSGDYFHIPTVSFDNLVYGTYSLQIIATSAVIDKEQNIHRYEYYLDGVRIYNPLGTTQNYESDVIKDAYGKEVNAVFTEVRDILLNYGDFNVDMPDDTVGKQGAVFIDQIKPGQESGNDKADKGTPTYEIGTFKEYGPKNEVYLSSGQAVVLKVKTGNHYYVGLKSLTGAPVQVNVSGINKADPTTISISHATDLYYEVTPVDGYIVIQNGGESGIVSITNLRTTNYTAPVEDGGVLPVERQQVLRFMSSFTKRLNEPEQDNTVTQPEETPAQQQVKALFGAVRTWLRKEGER